TRAPRPGAMALGVRRHRGAGAHRVPLAGHPRSCVACGAVDRGRILVYRLDVLCESGHFHRARAQRFVRRHSPRRRARLHRCATRRRGAGCRPVACAGRTQGGDMNTPASRLVDTLNRECDCSFTDFEALRDYAHFFSAMPVFLEEGHAAEMRSIVGAVEAVVGLADYPSAVLKDAPSIAKLRPRTSGAFMGFDFHISPSGPRLIEINTNAGGALLNIAAREAQRACCSAADEFMLAQPGATELEREVIAMFEREWRLA